MQVRRQLHPGGSRKESSPPLEGRRQSAGGQNSAALPHSRSQRLHSLPSIVWDGHQVGCQIEDAGAGRHLSDCHDGSTITEIVRLGSD